jgi:hypothetical protein
VADRLRRYVTGDDALVLDVDARLAAALGRWVQLGPDAGAPDARRAQARVHVHEAPVLGVEVPRIPPTLRVGTVGVWLREEAGTAVLGSGEADCAGAVDLHVLQATVVTSASAGPAPRLYTMLELAVGMLLGRIGRALVRAAVVAPPGGGAWLLVGEEGTGTTTTLLRLTAAGWKYLAIDQAILGRRAGSGSLTVEGWPGPEAAELVGARRLGEADLEGVLLLRQAPLQETGLLRRRDLDIHTALLPSSPWLRLDTQGASGVLRTLRQGVRAPVFELHLGLDSYSSPGKLAELLGELPGG